MTRVSVALCTYNGAAYIREQLESIIAQTRPVDEIVIGDDGSSDATLDLVRDVLRDARPEVVVLSSGAGLGVTANFARTMAATTGDVVVLSDQDDVWQPERVAGALAEIEAGAEFVFSDARLVGASGSPLPWSLFEALEIGRREIEAVRGGDAFATLLRRNLATGATASVTRGALERALPFPDAWVHDEWLAVVTAAFAPLAIAEGRLVDYRQHDSNQIGVRKPTLRYKLRRILAPRGARYRNLERMARVLVERLVLLGAAPELIAAAEAKLDHQAARAALPASRIARVPAVIREARTGRYRRYSSQGRRDILRDLFSKGGGDDLE